MESEIEKLRRELAEACALNDALRKGEVDAVVGEKAVSVVRLHQVEQELHIRQKELETKNTELQRINEELKDFTYAVSHDLRAPLRTVGNFAQILQEDYGERLDDEGRMYLDRLIEGTARMNRLIDETLDLSRVSRIEVVRSPVDLSDMAGEIMDRYRQSQPDRDTEIEIQPGMVAQCDKRLTERVLENLLGNAWKYTGKERKTKIFFGAESREGKTVYHIRDNGVGFSMEYAKRLFTPFQRLHKESDFKGTGVGLSVVQRIVRRHGGEIWAESTVGGGSVFYFTLSEK